MIVQSDIVDILYLKAQILGIPVYRKGNIPKGEVKAERTVILPKKPTSETYWTKCYVEINICVPNLSKGIANLIRLSELERQAKRLFNDTGMHDDTRYTYEVESTNTEEDESLKCHYLNTRVLFKVLNVKK